MKKVSILLSICLLFITGVVIYLVLNGSALRSAGVIKPTEYSPDNKLLAKSVALRLFPEFQSNENTVWVLSDYFESSGQNIVGAVLDHYNSLNIPNIPKLKIFNSENNILSDVTSGTEISWWVFSAADQDQLNNQINKFKSEPNIIYISEFKRNADVPAKCESEKQLSPECLKLVSVREVKKKFKNNNPYFFMRRYNDRQFYLFIEVE